MCRHELYAGVDLDDREIILDCDACEREREWADEDDWDCQQTQLDREDRPDGWY